MWLVMDIGCLECQLESSVVGVYETREEAREIMFQFRENNPEDTGHEYMVFQLPILKQGG